MSLQREERRRRNEEIKKERNRKQLMNRANGHNCDLGVQEGIAAQKVAIGPGQPVSIL